MRADTAEVKIITVLPRGRAGPTQIHPHIAMAHIERGMVVRQRFWYKDCYNGNWEAINACLVEDSLLAFVTYG